MDDFEKFIRHKDTATPADMKPLDPNMVVKMPF